MYKVRLDKRGVEFGFLRKEFVSLQSLYDWIGQTYSSKVDSWLLEEDGSGGEEMPPIANISHFVDNDMSVDLEGWLKTVEDGCDAYFFHITKD